MSCDTVKMGEADVDEFPIVERRMLPIEMLERVFMFLPPKDLKTVMLVCKRWKEVGSAPKLWSWVVLKLNHSSPVEDEGSGQQTNRSESSICQQALEEQADVESVAISDQHGVPGGSGPSGKVLKLNHSSHNQHEESGQHITRSKSSICQQALEEREDVDGNEVPGGLGASGKDLDKCTMCKEMRSRMLELEAKNHALTARLKEMQEQLDAQALQNSADMPKKDQEREDMTKKDQERQDMTKKDEERQDMTWKDQERVDMANKDQETEDMAKKDQERVDMAKKDQERMDMAKKGKERANMVKKNHKIKDYNDLFLKMIYLPRLAGAREIIVESFIVNDEVKLTLLCKALSHPGLKRLVIQESDVRNVEPQLLASFLTRMEELDLSNIKMSTEQSRVFLSALKESNKIKRLSWLDNNWSQKHGLGVYAYVRLPNALKKVEKLTLDFPRWSDTVLQYSTVQMIFEAWKEEDASVKSISLLNDDERQIRRGLSSEPDPDFGGWKLTLKQWTAICDAIKAGSALKKRAIPSNNLGEVECSVFSGEEYGVELNVGNYSLKPVEAEMIMLYVATSPGRLKKLILQGNDLEHVDATAIATVATKVESLNIAKTEISRKQAKEIFKAIARSPGALKNLNMDSNDLREVDPKVMADAVNKLEKVCFSDMPLLTQRQMRVILTQALEKGTTLKELSISPERRTMSVFHENQNQSMYNKLFPAKG